MHKYSLQNKPLSITKISNDIYFGDARGVVYLSKYPFYSIEPIYDVNSPISNLFSYLNNIFYSTWDGEVGILNGRRINLEENIVKAMIVFKDLVYVSIEHNLYILDIHLSLVNKIDVPHKILSFSVYRDSVICGMGVPFLGKIEENNLKILFRSNHDLAILGIHECFTASADGKVIKSNYENEMDFEIVYEDKGWIRSIYNQYLFSLDNKVIGNKEALTGSTALEKVSYNVLYEHEDYVSGVLQVKDKIVSIGLDYAVCIFDLVENLLDEEIKEIEELNKLFN